MSRNGHITIGIVLVVIGLGVTFVSYSSASGGGQYVIAWGAVAVGIMRIFRGLATREPTGPIDAERVEQEIGRSGPSRGEQVVGQTCVHCKKKIISVVDGLACRTCKKPLHDGECRVAHGRKAHRQRRPRDAAPAA